jgi:hypothetical protein
MAYTANGATAKATALAIAFLVLSASAAVMAGPPFDICRSTDPSQLGSVAPLDVVSTAPYDDDLDLLDDGETYYYMVRDDGAQRVPLSIHKNLVLNTVRIGFDDANPLSAPVDPSLSRVVASPDTVPADGISVASVIVTPRDSDGIPLGAGLDIEIDAVALWPGSIEGEVIDRGDGSYEIRIVSSMTGTGDVWVSVEGIALNDAPVITFEEAGDPMGLRELGRAQLDDMTEDGGLFEQVLTGLDPAEDPGAEKVSEAWDDALVALENLPAGDLSGDSGAIDNELKSAVGNLVAALDDPGDVDPGDILSLIDYLLDAARWVALEHLELAEESCGPCGESSSDKVCEAEQALADADAERESGDPDYEQAANLYGTAVDKAGDAVDDCS